MCRVSAGLVCDEEMGCSLSNRSTPFSSPPGQAAALCQHRVPLDLAQAMRAMASACEGRGGAVPAPAAYLRFLWDAALLEVTLHIHQQVTCAYACPGEGRYSPHSL